jgi:hypothetical protein
MKTVLFLSRHDERPVAELFAQIVWVGCEATCRFAYSADDASAILEATPIPDLLFMVHSTGIELDEVVRLIQVSNVPSVLYSAFRIVTVDQFKLVFKRPLSLDEMGREVCDLLSQ